MWYGWKSKIRRRTTDSFLHFSAASSIFNPGGNMPRGSYLSLLAGSFFWRIFHFHSTSGSLFYLGISHNVSTAHIVSITLRHFPNVLQYPFGAGKKVSNKMQAHFPACIPTNGCFFSLLKYYFQVYVYLNNSCNRKI